MSAEGGILNIVGMNDLNFLLNGNPSQQKNEDDIIENKIFTKLFKRRTYSKYRNFGLQKFRIDYDGQRDLNLTSSSTFVFKISRYADLLSNAFLSLLCQIFGLPYYRPTTLMGWKAMHCHQMFKNGVVMNLNGLITLEQCLLKKYP
jgi:hypothetical protein